MPNVDIKKIVYSHITIKWYLPKSKVRSPYSPTSYQIYVIIVVKVNFKCEKLILLFKLEPEFS